MPQGISLTTGRIFEINLSTQFYSLFLPGALSAGVIRWYKLSRPDGRRAEALAVVIINRILEIGTIAAVGLAFWLWDGPARAPAYAGATLGCMVLAGFSGYALAFNKPLLALARKILGAAFFLPRALADKLRKLFDSVGRYGGGGPRLHAMLIATGLLRNLADALAIYAVVRAIGLDLSLATIAWMQSLVALLTMLPISLSGIGVREAGYVLLLRPFGVAEPTALALSLLWFSSHLAPAALGGLIEARLLFGGRGGRRPARGTAPPPDEPPSEPH